MIKDKTQRTKTSMALFFIKSCYRFYQRARKFEEENDHPNEDFNADIIGGLISSVSFLECFINEIYINIADDDIWICCDIAPHKAELVRKMWTRNIPRTAKYGILEKYDILLDLIEKQSFDKGKFPYQDANLLVEIRNELVHFEPRWYKFDTEAKTQDPINPHKLESKLKGKFKPSQLHKTAYFLFPHYCFSSDCLYWAFNSAKCMATELAKNAGFHSFLDGIDWEKVV